MDKNLMLPGNPRYQPKKLVSFFGYDNLFRGVAEVEFAVLDTMAEIGVIPANEIEHLTPLMRDAILSIRTTDIDTVEREVTKHDIRAWVITVKDIVGLPLSRWIHVPLTSYDPLDTGRMVIFTRGYREVLAPSINEVIGIWKDLVVQFADQKQIGRTHGQHALPITVGFWLATTLHRVLYNARKIKEHGRELVGKISGAVGAYNAQVGLGIAARCGSRSFEVRVLEKLGLEPAPISTQILPPEPMSYFLFSVVSLSAALGQLGRDCRNLMRTEIREISEPGSKEQIASSTLVHKDLNPVNFENLEGTWWKNLAEFVKVLLTLISEHQRDLVGSTVARDFPTMLVNVQQQLDTLLRCDRDTQQPFLARLRVNREACERNLKITAPVILGEPLYIALQMAGFERDAHRLVNKVLVPRARQEGKLLVDVLYEAAQEDAQLNKAVQAMPPEMLSLMHRPESYTGWAKEKALEIAARAEAFLSEEKVN